MNWKTLGVRKLFSTFNCTFTSPETVFFIQLHIYISFQLSTFFHPLTKTSWKLLPFFQRNPDRPANELEPDDSERYSSLRRKSAATRWAETGSRSFCCSNSVCKRTIHRTQRHCTRRIREITAITEQAVFRKRKFSCMQQL